MSESLQAPEWRPATGAERYKPLDILRGLALFGVLLVNLETVFRVSLFQHILVFHTEPGWANHLTDWLVAGVLEFKALTLFCLLFGVGTALQAERASSRGVSLTPFLLRRFAVLLALGLCHLWLFWNGDILALYAVCGLLLVPFVRLPWRTLVALGAAVIALPYFIWFALPWPDTEALRVHVDNANRTYGHGSFWEILRFRWQETRTLILPLLLATLPRTLGLMMWGVAAWRSGILREPAKHRTLLVWTCLLAGVTGAAMTAMHMIAESSGQPPLLPGVLVDLGSSMPLALAYAAGLLLWLTPSRSAALPGLAAAGRMALTNYLAQSVILSFLFYGYGLGLFGRIGTAPGALIGIALYAAQLAASRWWLQRFRFGPVEWLWRSLTYGRRQPIRRA